MSDFVKIGTQIIDAEKIVKAEFTGLHLALWFIGNSEIQIFSGNDAIELWAYLEHLAES